MKSLGKKLKIGHEEMGHTTAQDIINKNPNIPHWVAEEMIWLENTTGKPYGEIWANLLKSVEGKNIFELLGYDN